MLLLFVVTPMLFCVGYLVKQKVVQLQMIEALEKKMLQTIEINEADLVWEKQGKEANIDGELFDVKAIHISHGKATLTGLFDIVENKLNKDFAKLFEQKNKANSPFNTMVLKFIFSSGIIPQNTKLHTTYFYKQTSYFYFNESVVLFSSTVASPPPNV